RVVQFASVGFDVTVWDLIMSLCVGGRIIVVPAERRVAGPALTEYIAHHRATHMILPPSLVSALPQECELPHGAVLVVGTEAVPSELIARWDGRLRVVVAYGLTEATVNSTLWLADPDRIGITAESRVVQFASVGFDVTVWDLIMSLCVGGRIIVVPAERRVAGPALT
ncbi:AMP-binding protein, partial [Streptomyces venezuelae]|uniref:AMP-binding protein n=1 Tax=Streptomyces venezuelae TaxID=54571 RepID=UPI001F17BBA6